MMECMIAILYFISKSKPKSRSLNKIRMDNAYHIRHKNTNQNSMRTAKSRTLL